MKASSKPKVASSAAASDGTRSAMAASDGTNANDGESVAALVNEYVAVLANKRAKKPEEASTPELELRFGKEFPPRSSVTLNKSHFDSVIQWLLSTGFETDGASTYLLRVSPVLNARLVEMAGLGVAVDDNVRLEVEGFSPVQDYCNNEDIVQLAKRAMRRASGLASPQTAATAAPAGDVTMAHVSSFMRFVRKTRRFHIASATTAATATAATADRETSSCSSWRSTNGSWIRLISPEAFTNNVTELHNSPIELGCSLFSQYSLLCDNVFTNILQTSLITFL
jgi:hypothetical protein